MAINHQQEASNRSLVISSKSTRCNLENCMAQGQIDALVFSDCVSLRTVSLPDRIAKIGIGAFSACISLVQINIPDSVTEIDSHAFSGCESLVHVSLSNVKEINKEAFINCPSLTISAKCGSNVENYCKANNLKYICLDKT